MDPDQAVLLSDIELTWVMMMMLHTVCPQYFHSQIMFAKFAADDILIFSLPELKAKG